MAKKGERFPGKAGDKVPRGNTKIVFDAEKQVANSIDKNWDAKLRAEVPGKRRSRNKKTYYEYRENRTDLDPDSGL